MGELRMGAEIGDNCPTHSRRWPIDTDRTHFNYAFTHHELREVFAYIGLSSRKSLLPQHINLK